MSKYTDHSEAVEEAIDENCQVQFLLQRRVFLGEEQYFVLWKNTPISKASWETKATLIEHHDGKELIRELKAVEESRKAAWIEHQRKKEAGELKEEEIEIPDGFQRGLQAEKIIAASFGDEGDYQYCIKWGDTDEADNVPAARAKACCPQLVADFEKKLALESRGSVESSVDSGRAESLQGEREDESF